MTSTPWSHQAARPVNQRGIDLPRHHMGGAIRDNLKAEQMEKFPNHFSVTNKSPPENRPLISKRPQNETNS